MAFTLKDFTFYQISETAVSIEFGDEISEETLEIVTKFNRYIKENPFLGLLNTIPAYTTLTLYFNPVVLMNEAGLKGQTCLDKISAYIKGTNFETKINKKKHHEIVQIPVCYDVKFGLDLEELTLFYQLKKEEIIEIHSNSVYTVFMIGFVPGFPYLGGLSDKLIAPRKQNPRKVIPAGSVGIAGHQTGIYPLETPGGWQIIGRTPIKLFDANRTRPSLLKAGDQIKFEPISLSEFERLEKKP
nr:5-oxoprolinase subunit PxpB [Pseudopedobacter sp.]